MQCVYSIVRKFYKIFFMCEIIHGNIKFLLLFLCKQLFIDSQFSIDTEYMQIKSMILTNKIEFRITILGYKVFCVDHYIQVFIAQQSFRKIYSYCEQEKNHRNEIICCLHWIKAFWWNRSVSIFFLFSLSLEYCIFHDQIDTWYGELKKYWTLQQYNNLLLWASKSSIIIIVSFVSQFLISFSRELLTAQSVVV